jgi:hypothetical protein
MRSFNFKKKLIFLDLNIIQIQILRYYFQCNTCIAVFIRLFKGLRDVEGYGVAHLVEALLYKQEGRGFDSRCCHWNFSLT